MSVEGLMQLPIVAPAPIVIEHSQAFRHLFNDHRQFDHFQNYLTGLIILEDKSLANISRCLLNSSDKTNLSRFMSESPWEPKDVNQFRIQYLIGKTAESRGKEGYLILDDTLCEHVGGLFEYIARHYDHCDDTYPLAHNIVTSHYLSDAVRFPVDFVLYRRYEEVTRWEDFIHQYFPEQKIPNIAKEKQALHKKLDVTLLEDPEFAYLHEQFISKIKIAQLLIKQALEKGLDFSTVLMDSWYLSPDLLEAITAAKKNWVSLLKANRKIETNSFHLKDSQGKKVSIEKPQLKVEELVPLIPNSSYRKVSIGKQDYWCFTFTVRISGLGRVRLVISFNNAELRGNYAVLVTNCTTWSAKEVLEKYLNRWPIETFYRDSKQLLGLDEYRTRTYAANEAHWCLVFVAYSLLHLGCLPPSSKKGNKKPIKTIGEVCRQQTQKVVENLITFSHDLLNQGCSPTELFRSLFSKQHKGCSSDGAITAI
jgi:SRSO17 transposase